MNLKLQLALKDDLKIEFGYFKEHDYLKTKGKLLGVSLLLNYVRIDDVEISSYSITVVRID